MHGQRLWDLHKKMKREEEHLVKNMLKDDSKGREGRERESRAHTVGKHSTDHTAGI